MQTTVSIARRLTIAIGLLALVVTLLASGWFYHQARLRANSDFAARSRQTSAYLKGTLQSPLWNIEDEAVKDIGRSLMDDPTFESVNILDTQGKSIFSETRGKPGNALLEEIPIEHKQAIVGRVLLGYSLRAKDEEIRFFLLATGSTFFAVLLTICFGTIVLVRRLLKQPIEQLCSIAEGYGSDDRSTPSPAGERFQEFAPLLQVLETMKNRINQQIVELKDRERYNKTLFQDSHIPLVVMDPVTYRFLDCNEAAVKIYQLRDKAEVLTRTPAEVSAPVQYNGEPASSLVVEMTKHALEKGAWVFEWRHLRPNGQFWDAEVQLMSFRYQEKPMLQFSLLDITERKRLEEQLRHTQKMEAIGTLAGGIAHDFNNILTPIFGYLELAQMAGKGGLPQNEILNEIRIAANRAKELVQQILSFSRKGEHRKSPIQVSLIVKEAMKLLRQTIPTTIEIRQDLGLPFCVFANPTQIFQVVMNLCTNSFHAMEKNGGVLTVSLREILLTEADRGTVENHLPPGRYLVLEVADTGIGMDEETRKRIFDPFFTTKEVGKGTGLGLAVVHGIVKDLQGHVTAISERGKGTTMQVFLPRVHSESSQPGPSIKEVDLIRGSERVLFVDDEGPIRAIAETFLTRAGYQIRTFGTGAEALGAITSGPTDFDLLITDMAMPGMSGQTLAQLVQQVAPRLPIILCTGFSETVSSEDVERLGIKAFVQKPVAMSDLLVRMRQVLDQAKTQGGK